MRPTPGLILKVAFEVQSCFRVLLDPNLSRAQFDRGVNAICRKRSINRIQPKSCHRMWLGPFNSGNGGLLAGLQ